MKTFIKRIRVLILFTLFAGVGQVGQAGLSTTATLQTSSLWTPVNAPHFALRDEPCRASVPRDATASAPQYVRLNHERIAVLETTTQLPLTLADGRTYAAVRREILPRPSGESGYVWTGTLTGQPDSSVILVVSGDQFYGRIGMAGQYTIIHRIDDAIYAIEQQELDAAPITLLAPDAFGIDSPQRTPLALPPMNTLPPVEEDTRQISLMVVYTPAARSIMERVAGSVALAVDGAVAQTNLIFQNSGIDARLKLVLVHPVFYLEQPNEDVGADLRHLMGVSDGYMDEVHLLRDQYAADLVAMISGVWFASYSGIAPVPSPLDAAKGFSITEACNLQDTTFTEQIGLTLGSTRDAANAGTDQPVKPYGYGYQAPDASFVTVMARRTSGICPPILTAYICPKVERFSNPQQMVNGQPLGSANADNVRSINELAPLVADYRQPNPDATVQLVMNGGFEIDADADRTPDFWKPTAFGSVKTACKQTGYNSRCALKFSGPGSRIKQKLPETLWSGARFAPDAPILLSAWVRTRRLTHSADLRLITDYEDGSRAVLKLVIPPGTMPHFQLLSASGTAEQKPIRKLKLVIRLASQESGKLWLDDVQVAVYAATVRGN